MLNTHLLCVLWWLSWGWRNAPYPQLRFSLPLLPASALYLSSLWLITHSSQLITFCFSVLPCLHWSFLIYLLHCPSSYCHPPSCNLAFILGLCLILLSPPLFVFLFHLYPTFFSFLLYLWVLQISIVPPLVFFLCLLSSETSKVTLKCHFNHDKQALRPRHTISWSICPLSGYSFSALAWDRKSVV